MIADLYQPIFTVERSGLTEVVVRGAISVVTSRNGTTQLLITLGDVNQQIWTRSVLKPWQLISNLPTLQKHYPELKRPHFAVMTGSHVASLEQLGLLRQIAKIGDISEDLLLCPPWKTGVPELVTKFADDAVPPQRIFHNCSGKHFAYLMRIKAEGGSLTNYIAPNRDHFKNLVEMLSVATGRPQSTFSPTIDGCQLTNYALSPVEMSKLFKSLARGDQEEATHPLTRHYELVASVISEFPSLVGGKMTLDARIMNGQIVKLVDSPRLVAKVGAEGLLAVGIGATTRYPEGVGILIKIGSGWNELAMELAFAQVVRNLGLVSEEVAPEKLPKHIERFYHIPALQ